MSFGDDDEQPWYLGPDDTWERDLPEEIQRAIEEYNREHAGEEIEPEDIEQDDVEDLEDTEALEEIEDIPSVEMVESEYLAPDNEVEEDWELAHHFDFYEDALNYVAGVPYGVLYIVIDEDGSADVYRDPDYESAAA